MAARKPAGSLTLKEWAIQTRSSSETFPQLLSVRYSVWETGCVASVSVDRNRCQAGSLCICWTNSSRSFADS